MRTTALFGERDLLYLLCIAEQIHALLDRFAIPVKRDLLYGV